MVKKNPHHQLLSHNIFAHPLISVKILVWCLKIMALTPTQALTIRAGKLHTSWHWAFFSAVQTDVARTVSDKHQCWVNPSPCTSICRAVEPKSKITWNIISEVLFLPIYIHRSFYKIFSQFLKGIQRWLHKDQQLHSNIFTCSCRSET